MRAFADKIANRFGAIDVMINNAGVMPLAFYADHEAAAEACGTVHRHQHQRCAERDHRRVRPHDQSRPRPGGQHLLRLRQLPHGRRRRLRRDKAAVNVLFVSLRKSPSAGSRSRRFARPACPAPASRVASSTPRPSTRCSAPTRTSSTRSWPRCSPKPAEHLARPDSIQYAALAPDLLADQVIYTMNKPWGVSISDITIRASNDDYVI